MDLFVYCLTGLLFGWVTRDFLGKRKLDPNVIRAANEQIEQVRGDLQGQLERMTVSREKDRLAFADLLGQQTARVDYWQARASQVKEETPSGRSKRPTPSPIPATAPEDIEKEYRLATKGAEEDDTRTALLDRGLTPDEADAILKGEYGDLPSGERLDLFVQESVRDSTGMQ